MPSKLHGSFNASGSSGSSFGKSMRKTNSLPSLDSIGGGQKDMLKLPKYSPFEVAQSLVTVTLHQKHIRKQACDGKKIKHVSSRALPFMTAERGLEYERPGFSAKPAEEPLPPKADVLRSAIHDLNLEWPPAKTKLRQLKALGCGADTIPDEIVKALGPEKAKYKASLPFRSGPRLPHRRPKASPEEISTETSRSLAAGDSLHTTQLQTDLHDEAVHDEAVQDEAVQDEATEEVKSITGELEAHETSRSYSRMNFIVQNLERPQTGSSQGYDPYDVPWSEDELKAVFQKFDVDKDQEVHVDDLTPLCRYLGGRPSVDEVMRLVRQMTQYATLNFFEFEEFIRKYREFDVSNLKKSFDSADKNGNGVIDIHEMHAMLMQLGYSPTYQTTMEAVESCDKDGDNEISFAEFEHLREFLRSTGGFSKADVQELRAIFERASKCKGHMDELGTDDIWRLLLYLGYSASRELISCVSAEVDADGTGLVSFDELLKIIKRIRDLEMAKMEKMMLQLGMAIAEESKDAHRYHLPFMELGLALVDLGYFVSEDAVYEILDSMGALEMDNFLTMEELGTFIRGYRRCEGFTQAEIREMQESFNKEAGDLSCGVEDASLDALALGRLLRWFGFSRTLQQVQKLVEDIDFDGSGFLEFNEFLKLMRHLEQQEAKRRRKAFHGLDKNKVGSLSESQLSEAVQALNHTTLSDETFNTVFKSAGLEGNKFVDIGEFEAFFKSYRQFLKKVVRENAGYIPSEVDKMREIFNYFDVDRSDSIELAELRRLITEYFPEATKSHSNQKEMQKLLGQITGTDASSTEVNMTFNQFLWLMRACDDSRDEDDVKLETEVVKQCGFATEEIEGFRAIFSSAVNWRGELGIDALKRLLGCIVDLSESDEDDLVRIVMEVNPHDREVARFPQFLQLVKRITEDNEMSINDAVHRCLKKEQKKLSQKLVAQPV